MAHQFQTFAVRQAHVRQAQLVALTGEHAARFGERSDAIGLKPHARQSQVKQLADVRLVIDHQHPLGFATTAGTTFIFQ